MVDTERSETHSPLRFPPAPHYGDPHNERGTTEHSVGISSKVPRARKLAGTSDTFVANGRSHRGPPCAGCRVPTALVDYIDCTLRT